MPTGRIYWLRRLPDGELVVMTRFDAVLFDAGGVLVLPDPTVLAPLLSPYGGSVDLERHRRAHYASRGIGTPTTWPTWSRWASTPN
jgi:hypothetical protein